MLLAAICRKFFYSFAVPADYQSIEKKYVAWGGIEPPTSGL